MISAVLSLWLRAVRSSDQLRRDVAEPAEARVRAREVEIEEVDELAAEREPLPSLGIGVDLAERNAVE